MNVQIAHDSQCIASWNSLMQFDPGECRLLDSQTDCLGAFPSCTDESLKTEFSRRLQCSNQVSMFHFSFSGCATDFINAIFAHEADEMTTIITSSNEHQNVNAILATIPPGRLVMLTNDEIMRNDFSKLERVSTSKVFMYFASVQITSGTYVPEQFFARAMHLLKKNGKRVCSMLDDVQAMYLYPRDYSMHDYVLGTAHALVRKLDIGILLHKKPFNVGTHSVDFQTYFRKLDLVLSRKCKLFMFNSMIRQALRFWLARNPSWAVLASVPNYFSVVTTLGYDAAIAEKFKQYEIFFECDDTMKVTIRMRGQQYLAHPEMLEHGLQLLDAYLSICADT